MSSTTKLPDGRKRRQPTTDTQTQGMPESTEQKKMNDSKDHWQSNRGCPRRRQGQATNNRTPHPTQNPSCPKPPREKDVHKASRPNQGTDLLPYHLPAPPSFYHVPRHSSGATAAPIPQRSDVDYDNRTRTLLDQVVLGHHRVFDRQTKFDDQNTKKTAGLGVEIREGKTPHFGSPLFRHKADDLLEQGDRRDRRNHCRRSCKYRLPKDARVILESQGILSQPLKFENKGRATDANR